MFLWTEKALWMEGGATSRTKEKRKEVVHLPGCKSVKFQEVHKLFSSFCKRKTWKSRRSFRNLIHALILENYLYLNSFTVIWDITQRLFISIFLFFHVTLFYLHYWGSEMSGCSVTFREHAYTQKLNLRPVVYTEAINFVYY